VIERKTQETGDGRWTSTGLTLVNFKNLVHRGDQITDELYVLIFQVEQVFYVDDERDPDWACAVRRNIEMCMTMVRVKDLMTTKQITTRASLSSWIIIVIMIHKKKT
jgi:hypothetical protein